MKGRKGRKRGVVATLLVAVMLGTSSMGCIGRMATSGLVTKFNLSVTENRFGREAVFLILYILPVYEFAALIDLIIVNSIEFWSGTNPISDQERLADAGDSRTLEGPDGSLAVATLRADGSMDFELIAPDGERHRVNLAREHGYVVARDDALQPIARVDERGQIEPLRDDG